jgi:hypothetical protein
VTVESSISLRKYRPQRNGSEEDIPKEENVKVRPRKKEDLDKTKPIGDVGLAEYYDRALQDLHLFAHFWADRGPLRQWRH